MLTLLKIFSVLRVMEEIYENYEHGDSKSSENQRGPSSSERRFHGAVVLFLLLLSVFLLAGLIGLGIYHCDSAAELSTIEANLTERLRASESRVSSLTEELDRLQRLSKQNCDSAAELSTIEANLTERLRASESRVSSLTEELDRLQRLSKQKKSCPAGWTLFSCVCYLLSVESGSWDKGRKDCTDRGADLVVIESPEELKLLSGFAKKDAWIGLSDRDEEGTWKWIDGTPQTLNSWLTDQPDNGGGDPQWGEEDCAHIRAYATKLNDLSCAASMQWICEKIL